MSYGIQSKKLKKLVDFYSPFNNGQELKFITLFKGQQGLLRYLQTSPFQGIDSTSLQQRTAWFGSNYPDQTLKSKKLIQILLSPINNFGMKLHIIFSIITFIVSIMFNPQYLLFSWLGAVINLFTFIIVYVLQLVPEIYQFYDNLKIKSFSIEGFKVKVWRDNQKKEIHSHQLVVGDVVQLEPGDKIGADGLLIQGNIIVKQTMSYKELKIRKNKTKQCLRRWASYQQQAKKFQLEDDQQQIELSSPIILAGSQVESGQGRYVVLCVGKYSRIGNFLQNLYKAGEQRKSDIQIKMSQIFFQISKYLVLALVAFILLFICKTVVFFIIQNSFTKQNWLKICNNFFYGITIILLGMPIYHIIGLSLGSYYFKLKMYKTDEIWYKYAKDCGTMKQITSIIFDRQQQMNKINLLKWWNQQNMAILNQNRNCIENINICKDLHPLYQQMLVQSLMCQDISPYQVGLKINNFFIGANKRFISYIENALQQFGNRFKSTKKTLPKQQELQSNIEIEQSQNNQFQNQQQKSPKLVQIIYLKGSSEALLSQCTHIMHKNNGRVVPISSNLRQQITQSIQKMNALQQLSLITGYIEVHPNHPKFRQKGYKLVMLSLIVYKENHRDQQFQSLANLKQMEISITLLSSRGHQQTYATNRQMGFISMDRPSIQLKGYNFSQVVGGIICKSCKKSLCSCLKQDTDKRTLGLKNQDQFNRIYKHLNLISQANSFDKFAFSIGLTSANQKPCLFGRSITDIPAMRKSTLAATVYCQMQDKYVQSAAELILPDNKLVTLQKLVNWSKLYHEFCRKYLVFGLTPSLVAFITNFFSFLLFGNFCIDLLQFLWVSIVICPLFAQTFALNVSTSDNPILQKKKKQPIIDKISHKQISSQVITQVFLLLLILIIGPTFIPEDYDQIDSIISQNWSSKYNSQQKLTICSGIYSSIFANQQQIYSKTLQTYHIHSRHFTFIFNLFTIMQMLNYFNCCNIDNIKSINFIHSISKYSILIILFAIGLHITVIIYGSNILGLYPGGLTIKQWAICLGFSLMVIIVGLIIRQLPYDYQHEENKYKIWPNRCYNLAVMATMPRQSLQDFQIDQQLEIKRMAKLAQ